MKFRTEITPARWRESIGYDDTILSLGSCFANNIAAKLAELKGKEIVEIAETTTQNAEKLFGI